jgi:hypothetical protein
MNRNKALAKGIFIWLALVSAGPALASVSLCSQSLLREDFYVASLHNLAEMKMNLDLQAAKGRQTGVSGSKALAKVFAKKYSEFLQGTSSRFSEKQVRELLQKQIALIQRTNKSEHEKETRSRAEVQPVLGPLKFVRGADIPIRGLGNTEHVSKYAPESNSVILVKDNKEIHHLNLSTGKDIILGLVDEAAVAIHPSGKEIVVVTNENLKIVDLDQSKTVFEKSLLDLGISKDFDKYLIALDESGTQAVISSNRGELLVLDLQTGAGRVFKGDLFGTNITSVFFKDADHIFFHAMTEDGNSLGIMNLDLKVGMAEPWLKTAGKELGAYFFDHGQRVILKIGGDFRNQFEVHSILNSPALESIGDQPNINKGQIVSMMSLPNSDAALIERFDIYNNRTNFEARDFRAEGESYFHFIEWNFALGIFSSKDGRSVYVLVHDRANMHLQVWNRE